MHFYPGVAEYQEEGGAPYRVFLNEDTIRGMDDSFTGCPVFVMHVDSEDIAAKVDDLRHDADGWVVRSFYNAADGKHWCEFLVVSDRGLKAIKQGMRLSNAYVPKQFGTGGMWNGVRYEKEITNGKYEHLAIVPNPRYEESVVLTPEEFKKYNEDKTTELKRIANAKREQVPMKFNLFTRAKVENAIDVEGMLVVLPKSGKEFSISQLVLDRDAAEVASGRPQIANGLHLIAKDSTLTVAEVLAENEALKVENAKMKNKAKKKNDEDEMDEDEADEDDKKENDDTDSDTTKENEDDKEDKDDDKEKEKKNKAKKNKAKKNKAKCNDDGDDEEGEDEEAESPAEVSARKAEAKKKANALRNAGAHNANDEVAYVDFSHDQVARGKVRYGS